MIAITELIRNVSLVRKVRLENVIRVGFDALEKVIVGSVEEVGDDRHIIATVTEPFAILLHTQHAGESCKNG